MKQAQLETTAAHNSLTSCGWFKEKLAFVHLNWEYQVSSSLPTLLALADVEVAAEASSLCLRLAVEPRLCAYRIVFSVLSVPLWVPLVLALLTGIDLFRLSVSAVSYSSLSLVLSTKLTCAGVLAEG